jgi:hypothetical protein
MANACKGYWWSCSCFPRRLCLPARNVNDNKEGFSALNLVGRKAEISLSSFPPSPDLELIQKEIERLRLNRPAAKAKRDK